MLTLILELNQIESTPEITVFSLGDMTLSGSFGTVTSKDRSPDQSMMIFLSVVTLLDELRVFLQNKALTTHRYVGIDTSFQINFTKHPNNLIEITHRTDPIDIVSPQEIIRAIYGGVQIFLNRYSPYVRNDDPVTGDLHASFEAFSRAFSMTGTLATKYRHTQ